MRVVIPEGLKGKDLCKFLVANKAALIAQKKSMPIKYADAVSYSPALYVKNSEGVVKSIAEDIADNVESIRVKVVANAAYWCDSHMDVLLPNCWAKSIKERKGLIPHLHDHIHRLDAEIGDVKNIYSQEVSLFDLGLNQEGSTQALIFETEVVKSYNEKVFNKYKTRRIKQHSIGLNYVSIELAVYDEESEKEFDFWNKHFEKVINKEFVLSQGYFWVIPEIKLLENSAVLFGSNELTPTLEVSDKSTVEQPSEDTEEQPQPPLAQSFDLSKAISETKIITSTN